MAEADVSGIVERMAKVKAASLSGQSFHELLADEGVVVTPEPQAQLEQPTLTLVSPAWDQVISARPAEMAPVYSDEQIGLTERGWSAEVTSRHPALVAATMAELAGDIGGAAAAEPIDPLDAGALALAQLEIGFAHVRANNLKVRAISLANDRLSEGIEAASMATPQAQAAIAAAVEDAQLMAPSEAPAAPAPTPTPSTTTTTSTKAASTTPTTTASGA